MHLHHVVAQNVRRWTRRYPALRRFTVVTTLLTLLWVSVIYWGERSTFSSHHEACKWQSWEKWPADAAPHHMVLIADPQLVDPHTYPGRPWPLSSWTETYTDTYMARNFRMINSKFDPDSIVFLGDLFDGGREWSTTKARPLKAHQIARLERLGVFKTAKAAERREQETEEQKGNNEKGDGKMDKRSEESYKAAIRKPHDHPISKADHNLDSDGNDLKEFVWGEDGRWKNWDSRQWETDFARFGRIFFDHDQLYPHTGRKAFAAYEVPTDSLSVDNGARNVTVKEYATAGGKSRRVLTSLPGNHDVGFGEGVQLAVRDRFESQFGETNRIDVIGNHTFISVDTPSLSASGQFVKEGGETPRYRIAKLEYIWKPAMDFLSDLETSSTHVVSDALQEFYPKERKTPGFPHVVTHPHDLGRQPTADELAKQPKPQLPIVLLTHVPLFRDPDTDCGRMREKGNAISISAGYQYQNVLTRSVSKTVVERVSHAGEIVHVFSGDDHDYCDLMHKYNVDPPGIQGAEKSKSTKLQTIREITVKSFSWAMGVRKPGYLLVSLWNPVDAMGNTIGTPLPTIQTHLCLLPDQLNIFIDYALLLGATLIILLFRAIILGLRVSTPSDSDDNTDSPTARLVLPRFQPKSNGTANGYSTPSGNAHEPKGRQRASSTSTSNHNPNGNGNLGIQRNYNARTRSVSPATGYSNGVGNGGPLIDKAGFYPQVRWTDPDEESDEESFVGDGVDGDSQAKWKGRRRGPTGKLRRVVSEFLVSLLVVGVPSVAFYIWLIRNG